jgi:hypothetical protein
MIIEVKFRIKKYSKVFIELVYILYKTKNFIKYVTVLEVPAACLPSPE